MPWEHCDTSIADSEGCCPTCGITKEAWTLEFNVERRFVVKRRPAVRIELLDELDQPVPDVAYRVTLPDGQVVEGRLDELGFARVPCELPGECQVTFPELDADAWEPIAPAGDQSAADEGGAGGAA